MGLMKLNVLPCLRRLGVLGLKAASDFACVDVELHVSIYSVGIWGRTVSPKREFITCTEHEGKLFSLNKHY